MVARRQRRWRDAALVAVTACGIAACTAAVTTRIMGSWRDADYHGALGKVLVLSRAQEPGIRQLAERTLASKLAGHGAEAVPSTALMRVDEPVGRDTVGRAIAGKGFATVLVTRLIGVDLNRGYVPPDPTVYYLGAAPTIALTPGYDYRQPEVYIQIALYETAHRRLVWAMTTKSYNRGTVGEVIDSYTDAVVRTLVAQGLLETGPAPRVPSPLDRPRHGATALIS